MVPLVMLAIEARADIPSDSSSPSQLNTVVDGVQPEDVERPELPNRTDHPIPREDALAAASKPVVWTTNTLTQADAKKRELENRQREWVAGYLVHGDHSAACDAEGEQFIRTWIDRLYGLDAHADLPATRRMAENLATNPACTDPLLLTAMSMNTTTWGERTNWLELAAKGFEHSEYNAYVRLFATLELAAAVSNQPERVAALDAAALPLVRESLVDGSFTAADQEQCAVVFVSGWGKDFFSRNGQAVSQTVNEAGKSFKWLALVLAGQNEINEAWEARGHDFADKVSPDEWLGFRSHLAVARKLFSRAWELKPSRPFAASEMIEVALGEQSGVLEMRLWFDRALAAQIDYPPAWSIMRNGLRPRWYGSLEAMRVLGVTAVNTGRFDTTVPGQFLEIVREIEADQEGPRTGAIYGRADIWPDVQRVCEGYLANPRSPADADAWRSTYAVASYLAAQYRISRTQLEALHWHLTGAQSRGWGADLSLMSQEVAAHTGAYADRVAEAESARNTGGLAQALESYNQILSERGIGPRVRQFARCRAASLELEKRLQAGEWVDFMPEPANDQNWVFALGGPTLVTTNSLEIGETPGGHLLYSRVRVGRNFEVKGRFEFVKSSVGAFEAGLVMGMPGFDSLHGDWDWYSFRIYQATNSAPTAFFSLGWSTTAFSSPVVLNSGSNTFTFRLEGNRCSATVNGQAVFIDQKAPASIKSSENGFLLGLGAFHSWPETVRYQDIQVRKILR
jgi:hypothetical protein